MLHDSLNWFDDGLHAGLTRRLRRATKKAAAGDLLALRRNQGTARRLMPRIDRFLQSAESRPVGEGHDPATPLVPLGSDWVWRPPAWREPLDKVGQAGVGRRAALGRGTYLFHDCDRTEIAMRQCPSNRSADPAPYALCLEVFGFSGTYLSMAVDLPLDAVRGLTKAHLIAVDGVFEVERPMEVYIRLNIRTGPNIERLVREVPMHLEERSVAFDLAYTGFNAARVDKLWLDLICVQPAMNAVSVRDLVVSRRWRAAL
ncbi:DUF6478 family protein [Cognatishimia sp. F0-27]|uniref:DUF6478 family protein n=1 Tax=Cognatishimia sp. F0-27 TaxID=2816855 RepID=UPI001D0C5449|nr:DUF6478 family protein [Cognatishimia sp. F0-27]MCC1493024.1 hypothetical protein [Cognatishimia sp. F0-27]